MVPVDQLQAGPELDELVAKHVMHGHRADYSTSTHAALGTWSRIMPGCSVIRDWAFRGVFDEDRVTGQPILVGWQVIDIKSRTVEHPDPTVIAESDSFPVAVCRAALKAAGFE